MEEQNFDNIETIEEPIEELEGENAESSIVGTLIRKGGMLVAGVAVGAGVNYVRSHSDEWKKALAERRQARIEKKIKRHTDKIASLEKKKAPKEEPSPEENTETK